VTDFDSATFEKAFGHVLTAFRVKLPVSEKEELTRTYFKILDAHAIDEVIAAGKRCIEKLKRFPMAADWLGELAYTAAPACPADRRTMHAAEADDLARATALCFEDEPCGCVQCDAAGVTDRPLRFVPTELGPDEYERAFNLRTGKVEIVGHWAHGDELHRWYAARDVFFALRRRAPRTLFDALAVIVGEVVGEREPGMEG
jgi:hypothetical protein